MKSQTPSTGKQRKESAYSSSMRAHNRSGGPRLSPPPPLMLLLPPPTPLRGHTFCCSLDTQYIRNKHILFTIKCGKSFSHFNSDNSETAIYGYPEGNSLTLYPGPPRIGIFDQHRIVNLFTKVWFEVHLNASEPYMMYFWTSQTTPLTLSSISLFLNCMKRD